MQKAIATIFVFITIIYLAVGGLAVTSRYGTFNISPDGIVLNWTNNWTAEINISANNESTIVNIYNLTYIKSNYSQKDFFGYTGTNECWYFGKSPSEKIPLLIRNESGESVNKTKTLNSGEWEALNVSLAVICPPGRYWGKLNFTNGTNSSDSANISVLIDVPIEASKELNLTTGKSLFKGGFTSANYSHSYYFNTSAVENVTTIMVKMTGDVGAYLFDENGQLLANYIDGINVVPDADKHWEIRLWGYGNYTGEILFSTLNLTWQNDTDIDAINIQSSPGENYSYDFTIKNEGNVSYSLKFSTELWHSETISNSGRKNFTFIVPAEAKEVRAVLNWSNTGRYNLKLYSPSGLVANSSKYALFGNMTGATMYEKVNASAKYGLWTVEVENLTTDNPNYDLRFEYRVDGWIKSDWFNGTKINSSVNKANITINISIPSNAVDGIYKGKISLLGSNGIEIPLEINVSSGLLVVGGDIGNGTYNLIDNVGFNKDVNVKIPISNNGSQTITLSTSSQNLTKGSNYINFSYAVPNTLNPGQTADLEINFTLNTSTCNSTGVYTGWIYLNGSNKYESFNLTIKVELSNSLFVNVTAIDINGSTTKTNNSIDQNATFTVQVCWINATWDDCSAIGSLLVQNFSAWIKHIETGTRYPVSSSEYLKIYNGTDPFYISGQGYGINVTIPKNLPGGNYTGWVRAVWKEGGWTYQGEGGNALLTINATGLWFSGPESISLNVGESTKINVTIKNYGTLKATGSLSISGCSNEISRSSPNISEGCTSDLNIDPNETCWFVWNITAKASGNCTLTIGPPSGVFSFNNLSISVSVAKIAQEQQEQGGGFAFFPKLNITSSPSKVSALLGQNVSAQVTVKNTGSAIGTAKLNVSISDISYTIEPEQCTIANGSSCQFNITFSVPENIRLGNRSGKFIAYIKTNTSIKAEKEFVFEVLPTQGRKEQINTSLSEMNETYENLSAQFDSIKKGGFLNQSDIEKIEKLLNDSRKLLSNIIEAISANDWAGAEAKLLELNSTLTRISSELTGLAQAQITAEEVFKSNLWMWVVVGIIVLGFAAFIIYLLLPPKPGYHPVKGYRPKKERLKEIRATIKEGASSLKQKIKLKKKGKEFRYRYKR
ncbi:MAG: hypothetical protein QXG26_00060 [Candidatus Aenigmatarchaeota archaeon]